MSWLGTFAFGASIAAYHGRAATNSMHAHASIQLTVPHRGVADIADACGAEVSGPGLLTRPGQRHRLAPLEEVTLIFIEPHAPLAATLLEQAGDAGTSHLPDALIASIRQAATPAACIDCLLATAPRTAAGLEPRLAAALAWLAHPAHFSRTMRNVFGITPGSTAPIMRRQQQ